jgi:mono/diheme cytochrome c family protein
MSGGSHLAGILFSMGVIAALFPVFRFGNAQDADSKQIALGRYIYDAQCARCHGKNLEGQRDWQTRLPSGRLPAPPHDASGHTWHHPDKVLTGITKGGLKPYAGEDYESDMPAFANMLSEAEISAVISFIESTWPEREREHQKRVTANSKTN